eukprot:TRINITY_DN34084_c0_g2_i1.p1 TRINITY_DN34084_c0_g2~~TRINITY_DN34084_c0_g2_i1.p1  ORF type:complete len:673 (+),score=168.62 TRINITY_DN34084_c0_g2_i1:93-2111(+)
MHPPIASIDLTSRLLGGQPQLDGLQGGAGKDRQQIPSWLAKVKGWCRPATLAGAVSSANSALLTSLLEADADPNVEESRATLLAVRLERWEQLHLLVEAGGCLPAEAPPTCPQGHRLEKCNGRSRRSAFRCDGCRSRITSVHGCRACNYDLCGHCIKGADITTLAVLRSVVAPEDSRLSLLLQARAHLAGRDRAGATPLLWAISLGTPTAVQSLLEAAADVQARDDRGIGVVSTAAYRGDLTILRDVIIAGGRVNSVDKVDQTPLHFACFRGQLLAVELLLSVRADHMHRNTWGGDALYCAVDGNQDSVVEALLRHPRRVERLTQSQESAEEEVKSLQEALKVAKARGHQKVLQMLVTAFATEQKQREQGMSVQQQLQLQEQQQRLQKQLKQLTKMQKKLPAAKAVPVAAKPAASTPAAASSANSSKAASASASAAKKAAKGGASASGSASSATAQEKAALLAAREEDAGFLTPDEDAAREDGRGEPLSLKIIDLRGSTVATLKTTTRSRVSSLLAQLTVPFGSTGHLLLGPRTLHALEVLEDCGVKNSNTITFVLKVDLQSTGLCGKWEKKDSQCMAAFYSEKSESYTLKPDGTAEYAAVDNYDDDMEPTCMQAKGKGTWKVGGADKTVTISCTLETTDTTSFFSTTSKAKELTQTWTHADFLKQFNPVRP